MDGSVQRGGCVSLVSERARAHGRVSAVWGWARCTVGDKWASAAWGREHVSAQRGVSVRQCSLGGRQCSTGEEGGYQCSGWRIHTSAVYSAGAQSAMPCVKQVCQCSGSAERCWVPRLVQLWGEQESPAKNLFCPLRVLSC